MSPARTEPSRPIPAKPHALSFALEALAFLALVAAAIYLFKTNPASLHWPQGYNPTGSFLLSTLVAALPIVVLLGAMAVLRLKAHVAALAGLATALLAAIARLPHARAPRLYCRRLRRRLRHLSHLLDHPSRHLSLRPHRQNRPLRHAATEPHRHHRRQPPAASPHRLRARRIL